MRLEHRAWVSLASVPTLVEPVTLDPNGVRFTVQFILKNTGQNPAVGAFVNTQASGAVLPNKGWQQNVCRHQDPRIGTSVFPGDRAVLTEAIYVEKTELLADIARVHKVDPKSEVFISPSVTGCIVYQDAVTDEWHHTPFSLKMAKGRYAIALGGLPVNADQIAVMMWPENLAAPD